MAPTAVKKVDVNAIDKSGETALIRESRIGDSVFVRSLLEKGADVNISDPYGYTALIYASRYGYVHVVKLLTDNAANLDACDQNGYTSLMWASREGHADVVKLLLKAGANIDALSKDGKSTLMMEISNNHTENAKTLIESGANVNAADANGETPLMTAVAKNNIDIIKHLLDHGADVTVADKDGMTAIMAACRSGYLLAAKRMNAHLQIMILKREKEYTEHIQRIDSSKEVIQGRNQMYKLLLDPDVAMVVLTKDYIKDCIEESAPETMLGKGAFGVALYGQDKENSKLTYVVKQATVTFHTDDALEALKEIMQRDISALVRSRHTNIARMYGYWIHPQGGATDLYLLYEYPVNGNLLNMLIHDEKRQVLTAKRRIKIMYEVARALSFLHKGNITDGTTKYTFVHRDIKAGTIYLASDYTAKLMDCGVSKFVEDPTSKFDTTSVKMSFPLTEDLKVIGTPGYCCPSYASGKMLCYDASCDLYSFGIVMFELLTGWAQFGQSNIRSCSQNLIRKYYDKSVLLSALDELAGDGWNHVADDLCECALSCVKLDHRERPSTEEVFERLSDVYTRFVLSPTTSPTK